MSAGLFDLRALDLRRQRAERLGPELFLHRRVLAEILERLAPVRREFGTALVVGWPAAVWRAQLDGRFASVTSVDSLGALAQQAPGSCDLCIVIGELDTAEELPLSLAMLRHALGRNGLLVGAISGGNTLPQLRTAMRAADERMGIAAPHVHPRIEPTALAALLSAAGFADPVVDLDPVRVSYRSLKGLVADLRRMAATNVMRARPRRPLSRAAFEAARNAFADSSHEGRTTEIFELLHFAAWTPSDHQG